MDKTQVKLFPNLRVNHLITLNLNIMGEYYDYNPGFLTCLFYQEISRIRCHGNFVFSHVKL